MPVVYLHGILVSDSVGKLRLTFTVTNSYLVGFGTLQLGQALLVSALEGI